MAWRGGRWLAMVLLVGCGVAGGQAQSGSAGGGQAAERPQKVMTPEQAAYAAASTEQRNRFLSLREEARKALAVEMADEKAGECGAPLDTVNTLSAEQCYGVKLKATQANYEAILTALRAMLGIEDHPVPSPGQAPANSSPGERLAHFNQQEAAADAYRKLIAEDARAEFKGGTYQPVFAVMTEQRLLRLHLQEIAAVYDTEFSSR